MMITKLRKLIQNIYVMAPLCGILLLTSCSKEKVLADRIEKINSFSDKEIYLGTIFAIGPVAEFIGIETIDDKISIHGQENVIYKTGSNEFEALKNLIDEHLDQKNVSYLYNFRQSITSGNTTLIENTIYSYLDDFKYFIENKYSIDVEENDVNSIYELSKEYEFYDENGNINYEESTSFWDEVKESGLVTSGDDVSGKPASWDVWVLGYVVAIVVAVAFIFLFWIPNPGWDNDEFSKLHVEKIVASIATELSTD